MGMRRSLTSETFLHVAAGAVCGCTAAVAFYLGRGRRSAVSPEEGDELLQDHRASPECASALARVALGDLRGNSPCKLARRCLELVAVVWFPLGSAMLVVKPIIFLPLYITFYILPSAAQMGWAKTSQQPGLLLAGASPMGPFEGWRDARWPRLAASAGLLVLLAMFQRRCTPEVGYMLGEVAYNGYMDMSLGLHHHMYGANSTDYAEGPLTYILLFSPVPFLGPGGVLACPGTNILPVATAFAVYQRTLWWLTLLNVVVTVLELASTFFTNARPSIVGTVEEARKLATAIEHTTSKELLDNLDTESLNLPGLRVTTMPFIKLFPPGGLLFTAFMAGLDTVVLDGNTIINQFLTYNPRFGMAMVAIGSFSLSRELLAARDTSLRSDLSESRRRGIPWGGIFELLETERGIEAPLSFASTAYIFPFSVTSYWTLASSLFSMLSSLWGFASFVVTHADCRVE